jgi:integrase
MARLVVALVAIHGLGPVELTRLRLGDLDLPRRRLTVRRDPWDHTVSLDPRTHTLAAAWLRERRRRWPATANPSCWSASRPPPWPPTRRSPAWRSA